MGSEHPLRRWQDISAACQLCSHRANVTDEFGASLNTTQALARHECSVLAVQLHHANAGATFGAIQLSVGSGAPLADDVEVEC